MKNKNVQFSVIAFLCMLYVSNVSAQSIGGYNVYYGSLHNHSTVSDGSGSQSSAYSTAKANGLDFFSLADHAESTTAAEYTTTKSTADSYNQDGVFTAFYGFEWSHSTYGHIAIINSSDYTSSSTSGTTTFDGLLTWLSSRECVAFFNHPGREGSNSFDRFTDVASDKFVGMELWNKTDGFAEYFYNDGFYTGDGTMGYYQEANARGWKIGASGAEDNHGTNWGVMTPYKMAILANNLTRTDLYNAMKARRFYSTSDLNIALSFKMNGSEMGSTVTGGTLNMAVLATDGNAEAFSTVMLYKNGIAYQTWTINTTNVNQTYSLTASNGDWYFVKVTQADGGEAISSPIWVSGGTSNQAPTCSITSPTNGATFTAPANVVINASAADTDGTIAKVEFFQGTTKLGEDLTAPYSYTWASVVAGTYSLTAKATDNAGAITTSTAVSINVNAAGGTPVVVSKRIVTGMDDVEEGISGAIYTNSSDIELVYDGTTYGNQTIGLRFTGLNIPQGATITKAYIQFTCDEKTTGATSVTIKGEASDNAAAFTTASKNVSNRVKTTSSTAWNSIPSWNTVGAASANERTPEMKTIVQEIVNRTGYASTSAMAFIITGTGTRTAEAYEGSASQAPLLYVEYTSPLAKVIEASENTIENDSTVEEKTNNSSDIVNLFPNPTSDEIHIEFDLESNYKISIKNTSGVAVASKEINNSKTVSINLSELPSGVYFLQVVDMKNETVSHRTIIKK